jgi:hypothetical protein
MVTGSKPKQCWCEASRHFRSKKKKTLKAKIDELKQTGRSKVSETCIGTSMKLGWVTSLELM